MHLYIIYLYVFLYMCTHSSLFVFACTDVNVRGQLVEVSSLLLSCQTQNVSLGKCSYLLSPIYIGPEYFISYTLFLCVTVGGEGVLI